MNLDLWVKISIWCNLLILKNWKYWPLWNKYLSPETLSKGVVDMSWKVFPPKAFFLLLISFSVFCWRKKTCFCFGCGFPQYKKFVVLKPAEKSFQKWSYTESIEHQPFFFSFHKISIFSFATRIRILFILDFVHKQEIKHIASDHRFQKVRFWTVEIRSVLPFCESIVFESSTSLKEYKLSGRKNF